MKAAIGF